MSSPQDGTDGIREGFERPRAELSKNSATLKLGTMTATANVEDLRALLKRLKDNQRQLMIHSAQSGILPADGTIRKIADLENAIGAVELFIEEEAQPRR